MEVAMLTEIYPRVHARYSSLRVLGPHLNGFVAWLHAQGYPRHRICMRLRAARRLDARLRRRRIRRPAELTATALRAFAPKDSQDDSDLASLVYSLVRFFTTQHVLAVAPPTPGEELVAAYAAHLADVRGFAVSTIAQHTATVRAWLDHVDPKGVLARLCARDLRPIEEFLETMGARVSRESLQHTVAHLRGFLRFLAMRGMAPADVAARIDTPRVYRGERLPRALPWDTVLTFLKSLDRTTPMGRRDYAMFLLITTYGLRTSEVVALTLDDVAWREGQLRVPRPKMRSPLTLPLTPEVGAALLAYMRDGRPQLPHRQIFLRARAPAGTLKPTAVTEAFQGRVRRSGLSIPYQGPHCLRHSLAVHLLRQGTPLKTIGDLLGHRSAESTCVYLRLHVEDLRDVALDLPGTAQTAGAR
jgi:integrase/recombinase XerD